MNSTTALIILLVAVIATAALIFTLGYQARNWLAERAEPERAAPELGETMLMAALPAPPSAGRLQLVRGFGGAADPGFEAGYARDPFPTQADPLRTEADINEWLAVWGHRNRTMINRWKAGR